MQLFDSHVHLDAAEFDADRGQVLADARRQGVAEMLIPAISAAGWEPLRALCESEPGLHPAFGLHPLFLAQHRDADLDALGSWLSSNRARAVGECGLDYADDSLDRERQLFFLRAQLRLAREFDLPLVLHARGAFEQVILELEKFDGKLRGVVHSFSGSEEQARRLWKIGFHLGIGGPVTYVRAHRLRGIVAQLPIEYLLLETDAPDQPDAAHRGQRNEPARLVEILRCVAQLRGEPAARVAATTTANARRLFALESAQ
ncbi:MAG TPA: TatD family hydrolase [Rhodanobacteraceae bacterium]|jgi:TatD DNase family protein